jgi:hypothetical protein
MPAQSRASAASVRGKAYIGSEAIMPARLRPVAREVRIAVVHAQHGRHEAQDRVLLVVAFAIGQHDVPEAFDTFTRSS